MPTSVGNAGCLVNTEGVQRKESPRGPCLQLMLDKIRYGIARRVANVAFSGAMMLPLLQETSAKDDKNKHVGWGRTEDCIPCCCRAATKPGQAQQTER